MLQRVTGFDTGARLGGRRAPLGHCFSFLDKSGKRRRFRRVASVQARDAAHAEARRLMMRAAESGAVDAPSCGPRSKSASSRSCQIPRLFKSSAKILGTYTEDEFLRMSNGATGWLNTAIDLAGLAGARLGEVLAVEVMDVDFVAERIFVRRAFSLNTVLPPKNGDEGGVPLSPQLTATPKEAARGKLPGARLVTDERGRTPTRQDVLRHLKKFCSASSGSASDRFTP
jgi:integrase